ncbi:MAG: hypothetical protein QM642_03310 [Edaphocola sp.]
MKKTNNVFCLAVAMALACAPVAGSNAQSAKGFYKTPYRSRNAGSYSKSTGILSLGLGFPNVSGGYYYTSGISSAIPVPYVKYEHAIMDEVGIGGYAAAGFSQYKHGGYTDKIFALGIGALGYYHFNKWIPIRKLDVYAGAGIGVRNLSYSYDDGYSGGRYNSSHFSIAPIFKAGARYYFAPSFGVYGEAGYDMMSAVNLGISFRF